MKKLLSIITIIIAASAYADDDQIYWELRKIERAIEWQTFEEEQRERQRRHDKWMDEFFEQREQGERDHRYCEEQE